MDKFQIALIVFGVLICNLTWVGNRSNCDFVISFTGAESCNNILNPPQFFSELQFLLLLKEKHRTAPTLADRTHGLSLTHTLQLPKYKVRLSSKSDETDG